MGQAEAQQVAEWVTAESSWRATPGTLACKLDPSTVQTPALRLIDEAIVDAYEGREPFLIISLAPQEGKTVRVARYGALWMLMRNPDLRIALVSFDVGLAAVSSAAIRNDILTFNGDEGNVDLGLRLRQDSKAVRAWNLANGRGGVFATSTGGPLSGRPVGCLLLDDPHKDYASAESLILAMRNMQWWTGTARPRLAPEGVRMAIIITTRYHERDIVGQLKAKQAEDERLGLTNYDRWRILRIPAQADHDPNKGETDPLGREPGEWMLSARGRTVAEWEATKVASGPIMFSAIYQGEPTPAAGDVFQREWWARYDMPMWSDHPNGSHRALPGWSLCQSWDMSFKDKSGSDFVCGQVWAHRGPTAALLHQVHARLSFTDTLAAVRLMTEQWPQARAKYVEDAANGPAVIDTLKNEIGGIIPVTAKGSKYARAVAVQPFVAAGNVLLPSKRLATFDVDEFISELSLFPNAAHDDMVDAFSQALKKIHRVDRDSSPIQVAQGRVPGARTSRVTTGGSRRR